MANSEIYGKQRMCLYITHRERKSEEKTERFESTESENTKCTV